MSPILYSKDLIIFSFLIVYKNQLKKAEVLNALSSNHSLVFCSFVNNDTFARRASVWKFNNSLLFNTEVVKKLKIHIETVKSNFQEKLFLFRSLKLETFEIRDT